MKLEALGRLRNPRMILTCVQREELRGALWALGRSSHFNLQETRKHQATQTRP